MLGSPTLTLVGTAMDITGAYVLGRTFLERPSGMWKASRIEGTEGRLPIGILDRRALQWIDTAFGLGILAFGFLLQGTATLMQILGVGQGASGRRDAMVSLMLAALAAAMALLLHATSRQELAARLAAWARQIEGDRNYAIKRQNAAARGETLPSREPPPYRLPFGKDA